MTCGSPVWEYAADIDITAHKNKVLRNNDNYSRCTPVRDLHMVFEVSYIYDYMTKLRRQQAEIIHNHGYENFRNIGQGEARHRKYKKV
jgi:hypothetical protein